MKYSARLHRYAWFVLASIQLLIVAGGLVTSTDSGLSVPDWPLSYGGFFPPMIGGIRFEHSHRVIAGTVGIFTFILAALILKVEKRGWVKKLGVLAVLAVILQAVLGGLTVIYLLPKPVSISHACLGQTFFSIVAVITLVTSRSWLEAPSQGYAEAGKAQRLSLITSVLVYTQLVLGAVIRHTGAAAVPWHIGVAFLVLLHALLTFLKLNGLENDSQKLARHAFTLGALVLCQIFLGLGSYYYTLILEKAAMPRTAEVLFTTAHQSLGAAILATSVLLTFRTRRFLK
jgi:cytochrome c oxidase assembly protein subunit 15